MKARLFALCLGLSLAGCVTIEQSDGDELDPEVKERLSALVLSSDATLPPDVTNRFADNPAAADFGKQLFFETRFSGPLLDDANDGLPGTLGKQGETGRVACASCHVPTNGSYVDTRSSRGQLSLASAWTHRKSPALVDVMQSPFLLWDGKRSTAFSVVFGVVESPIEFNSSRLFVAQQIARFYAPEYEALFGPLPSLDAFPVLEAASAGCRELPVDALHNGCPQAGFDDEAVTRVVANMGKAVAAYMRLLKCGPGRFDAYMQGDKSALTAQERQGAELFVGKAGCDRCHSGPHLTDHQFHNVGTPGGLVPFTGIDNSNDVGAASGLVGVREDWLSPLGPFSDGDDGRLDSLPTDLPALQGAFRTPGVRCLSTRPSFMHNGELRSLHDVIKMFDDGGGAFGYAGTPDIQPLGLTKEEREALVAFLGALEGPGPDGELRDAPALP